jgi:membrane-bound lytic murein transglycosylase MltF
MRGDRLVAFGRAIDVAVAAILAWTLGIASAANAAGAPAPSSPAPSSPAPPAARRTLSLADKPFKGDLDAMAQRRMIRVLVPHSRTLYYNDKGRERGLTADLVRDFESYVNRKYNTGKRPLTVYLVPTTRDQLLPQLAQGLGDIAVGNLTVTPEREQVVDFVGVANSKPVSELVVTGANAPKITSVDQLAGMTVHVRRSSSYYDSLVALNERFRREGRHEMVLKLVPDALEDEDMMEMANAGLIEVLVVDDWKARIWKQVLPKLGMDEHVFVHEGGRVGWAIRKGSPQLGAAIDDFVSNDAPRRASYEYRLKQATAKIKALNDPTSTADWKRFQQTLALFERYGDQYGFDPIMLAAQGYQESRLDQQAKSHVGAIGVMQLMPATGAQMKVGDIHVMESNIHAGVKYMDILMSQYFPDAHFSEGNRPLFAFASYNAGPGNIAKMRKLARQRGLDPDKWFNNVELVVAEKIGIETTTYVRNIYKYYVSFKLSEQAQEARRQAMQQLGVRTGS